MLFKMRMFSNPRISDSFSKAAYARQGANFPHDKVLLWAAASAICRQRTPHTKKPISKIEHGIAVTKHLTRINHAVVLESAEIGPVCVRRPCAAPFSHSGPDATPKLRVHQGG